MSKILPFTKDEDHHADPKHCDVEERVGQIVIFPGVRYEYGERDTEKRETKR